MAKPGCDHDASCVNCGKVACLGCSDECPCCLKPLCGHVCEEEHDCEGDSADGDEDDYLDYDEEDVCDSCGEEDCHDYACEQDDDGDAERNGDFD